MARFVSRLHPRNPSNGKFVKAGTGKSIEGSKRLGGRTRPKVQNRRGPSKRKPPVSRSDGLKKNFTRVKTAYEVKGDLQEAFSSGAKAAAYGATGNYVKSALHGAKAGTATSRLGSRAAGAYVGRSKSIAPAKKRAFYASQAKFDDRVQTIDNVATIGLFLTGSLSSRSKTQTGTASAGSKSGFKPAAKRKGAYQITSLKGKKVKS